MAFDDGTPLDAAKLQELETKLNNIRASIPKVGTSTSPTASDNLGNSTTIITQKQVLGGVTDSVTMVPGQQVPINLIYNTDSKPTAIIMSPVKWQGTLKGNVSWYVEGGSISNQGARAQVYLESGAPAFGIRFFFMVICN